MNRWLTAVTGSSRPEVTSRGSQLSTQPARQNRANGLGSNCGISIVSVRDYYRPVNKHFANLSAKPSEKLPTYLEGRQC
jgi:hypothetical protein